MTAQWREVRPIAILDLDLECRPLNWYGGDWVTKEITAIGCQWVGKRRGMYWLLGIDDPLQMLVEFRKVWDAADMITGHYIRAFDLPLMNAAMIEYDLAPLSQKLTQDTKLDLIKFSGLSKSQENLGALLGLHHPKIGMDQTKWRSANRLEPAGIQLARKRVMGDVHQHIEMRAELLRRGMLGPPKVWTPDGRAAASYTP
jgi:hypothetical protein